MQILCLGPEGTYGHQVAYQINERHFEAQGEIVFRKSHEEIFVQLDRAKNPNDIGVVAIRNSTAGLVMEVVRFWLNTSPTLLHVTGEADLPIHHQLLARPGVALKEVQAVFSHPQGLAQCEQTLNGLGIGERKPVSSTAGAAKMLIDRDSKEAAISSRFCAGLYGLEILQQNLEDISGNTTRFHIVSNVQNFQSQPAEEFCERKLALLITLKNEAGSLWRTLGPIACAGLNMTFLTSIQLNGMDKVAFYIELDAHHDKKTNDSVLHLLSQVSEKLVVLGIFPKGVMLEG
jgi:prephenate dehydratase